MELLIDYFRLEPVQIVSESKESGTMKIRGIFGRAEEFNNNNRRYPKMIMEREVTKLMPLVKENRLLGELDHPDNPTVKLTNASHMITNLSWQGNVLIGESQLLNTPAGKVAQQLIKDGVRIGVSSRGLGSLKPCSDAPGKFEVNEEIFMDYNKLEFYPSTKGAYPSLVNESVLIEKTKKEAIKHKVFMNLLESKLTKLKDDRISKLFGSINEVSRKGKDTDVRGQRISGEREPKKTIGAQERAEAKTELKHQKELASLQAQHSSTEDPHLKETLKQRINKLKGKLAERAAASEAAKKAHQESLKRRAENPDDDSWQRGRNDSTELKGNLVNERTDPSDSIKQQISQLKNTKTLLDPTDKRRINIDFQIKQLEGKLKRMRTASPSEVSEQKVNPWAVCHASTGKKKSKKFERCVMDVKSKQNKK